MKRVLVGAFAILITAVPSFAADKIRIACIGDSVTFGDGIRDRTQTYPGQLQKLLGENYEVKNFGVNSMAVLKKADHSYFTNKAYKDALAFNPNIVIMQFGGNDSKTQNWPNHKGDFIGDYKELIESFKSLPTKPRIILNTTSPAFVVKWGIDNKVIVGEVIPQIRQTAFNENVEIIDINTALIGKGDWFPDKMHPGPEACGYMAKIVEGVLVFKEDAAFNIEKSLAAKGITPKVSNFHGFRQLDFKTDAGNVTIVAPHRVAADKPVAWRASLFGEAPQTDIGLLQRGYHVVHVEGEAKTWDGALGYLKEQGLTGKLTVIAMGAGAGTGYAWAAGHAAGVAAIYGDSAKIPADLDVAALAKAGVAIVQVAGQKDTATPAENAEALEKKYKAAGGKIEVIRKKDDAAYGLANPEPVLNFIYAHNAAK